MRLAAGVMGMTSASASERATESGTLAAEQQAPSQQQPAGAPPAFGTGPGIGPLPTPATFTEAEKLLQVQLSEAECAQAA